MAKTMTWGQLKEAISKLVPDETLISWIDIAYPKEDNLSVKVENGHVEIVDKSWS